MILLKGYKPITFESDLILLVSRKNKIFRYYIKEQKMQCLASLPWSFKQKLFSINRIAYRITRGGIKNGIVLGQSLYCSFSGIIWRIPLYNTSDNTPNEVYRFRKGHGPLTFTLVDDSLSLSTSFPVGIYFGEYFSNPMEKEVNIYRINKLGVIENIFTFKAGQINHVHNIIFDTFRHCAWVLTGDFEKSAGIWQVFDDFRRVSCVVGGEQKFRSCVAFALEEGLLYATDSQFETNNIRLLKVDEPSVKSIPLFSINGPSIYGTNIRDNFVFTTATEPEVGLKVSMKDIVSRELAPGIVANSSFVYLVTPKLDIFQLFSKGKDYWPYYLAQFGNILVPSGNNPSEYLVTYSVANKKNDQSTEIRHLGEIKKIQL